MYSFLLKSSTNYCLDVMMCKPSEWVGLLNPLDNQSVTELNIHFGLPMDASSDSADQCEHYKTCLEQIIKDVKPEILHMNHDESKLQLPEEIVNMLNKEQYLIQPLSYEWHIWHR